jgi:hypothetical protein
MAMAITVPTAAQQANAGHLVAGLTGALTLHRLTRKMHISPTKRIIFLALVAVAIAYWHRRSNAPITGLAPNDGAQPAI